ncbi:MAG: UvrD-helicase domain-containing protein [Lachnospiraceae bacterium]|nr:UvrD-helicase domain-containing protein [Lachnospiraceae bacterium]
MNKKWTDDQKRVIETKLGDLLVSAAAGSGKTAVLVERIIEIISSESNPIDIDRFIIMTFTRAAAAQMREKIGAGLEKLVQEHPEVREYRRQQKLLNNASISTIDSFCIGIVRDYFHVLDLDPAFRIADETELKLIKDDCMDELLERWYAKADGDSEDPEKDALYKEQFQRFVLLRESYANHKDDSTLAEIILNIASKALAAAWPSEWLDRAESFYRIETVKELNESAPAKSIVDYVKTAVGGFGERLQRGIECCNMTDGPDFCLPMIEECVKLYDCIMAADSYSDMSAQLAGVKFMRMSTKKCADTDLLERVKGLRENFKSFINAAKESFFYDDLESVFDVIRKTEPVVSCLIELTREFLADFAAKKRSMNLLDFNDAEHFALDILVTKTENGRERSAVAKELQKQFDEIIIDEYQDSNEIQEEIVNAIAGAANERPYVFTVGDVKQSIYKFRNACPELFIRKQDIFRENSELGKLIVLDRNFRSREEVLEATNDIFKNVMHRSIGGIDYDDECSLKCGTEAQKNAGADAWMTTPYKTECIMINEDALPLAEISADAAAKGKEESVFCAKAGANETKAVIGAFAANSAAETDVNVAKARNDALKAALNAEDGADEMADLSKREQEALLIARRIRHLVNVEKLPVREEKNGEMISRPVGYGDIVILLRSLKEWADVFCQVLEKEGIPVYSDIQAGFFKAAETSLTLNYLRILDNPRDDIALVAVLSSFIGGFDVDELAEIKIIGGNDCQYFYDAVLASRGAEEGLNEKLEAFFETYNALHALKNEFSTPELISELFNRTGIYTYYSAMPDGQRRSGNLDLLLGYASNYEQTGYSGLFSFIRYIEKLKGKDLDYGEAGNANVSGCVKIMSIHKSKGLEFPVVVLAGLGKNFNENDFKGDVLISSEYGIGARYIDLEERVKYKSLFREVVKTNGKKEMIGEEMRLLYVAMTRAKEKLIMTGIQKKLKENISYTDILFARSYAEFIYPTAVIDKEHINTLLVAAEDVGNEAWVGRLLKQSAGDFADDKALRADTTDKADIKTEAEVGIKTENEAEAGTKTGIEAKAGTKNEIEAEANADKNIDTDSEIEIKLRTELDEEIDFAELLRVRELVYPKRSDAIIPVKLSVSDLKHQAIEEEEGENPFTETRGFVPGGDKTLPSFMKNLSADDIIDNKQSAEATDKNTAQAASTGQNTLSADLLDKNTAQAASSDKNDEHKGKAVYSAFSATEYGTLMHKCMQFMPMNIKSWEEVSSFLQEMLDKGQIDEAELSVLKSGRNTGRFTAFLNTAIADRIRKADSQGDFYREKQFMIAIKACEADSSRFAGIEEMIPVQGVIDAMFEENGELVILDYKTDSVPEGDGQKLADRYRTQLDYYAMAAERLTGLKVKEKLLYSFSLGETIEV